MKINKLEIDNDSFGCGILIVSFAVGSIVGGAWGWLCFGVGIIIGGIKKN